MWPPATFLRAICSVVAANLSMLRNGDSLRIGTVLCHRNPFASLLVLVIPEEFLRKLFHTPNAERFKP